MKLYTYYRSSAAYRVRIALNLKQLSWDAVPVDLLRGEDQGASFRAVNPQGVVPALDVGQHVLTQSMAIVEYLDETYPQPPLLPEDPEQRAWIRACAQLIACDIHPLNNLRVLQYLRDTLGASDDERSVWYAHWITTGFDALETQLAQVSSGDFCVGDQPSLADIALVPQVYNAQRFAVDLAAFPRICRVNTHCLSLPAFAQAAPECQGDAPDS